MPMDNPPAGNTTLGVVLWIPGIADVPPGCTTLGTARRMTPPGFTNPDRFCAGNATAARSKRPDPQSLFIVPPTTLYSRRFKVGGARAHAGSGHKKSAMACSTRLQASEKEFVFARFYCF